MVDSDEAIRRSAHHLLGVQGAVVETARDGHEAVALMRQTPYSAALVDIRLPDLDGYQIFHRLHEIQPQTPVILMTGFGYDPTHSIVKARQEGLQTVLYKPFRSDRLMEAVEQALRVASAGSASHGPNSDDTTHKGPPPPQRPSRPLPRRQRARKASRARHQHPRSRTVCTTSLGPRRSCDMSLESPWLGVLGAILVPALGHLYHFILAVNVTSGWGLRETSLTRLRLVLVVIFGTSAACLLASHVRDPWWNWAWPLRSYAYLCLVTGGLILPLTSLGLGMRRRPSGVAGRSDLLDLEEQLGNYSMIGTGKGSWLLRLPGNESFQLLRREWVVHHPGLPRRRGFDDRPAQRFALRTLLPPCFLRARGGSVPPNGRPTCLSSPGTWSTPMRSFPGSSQCWNRWKPGLASMRYWETTMPSISLSSFRRAGRCRVRIARGVLVHAGRERCARLALGGTSAPWGPGILPGSVPAADFRILLSHSPDQFYKARAWGVDLMLSGHNHGGQIRLPAFGPVFMPSLYSRRLDRGFFRSGSTFLYVSEGVAGKHPFRYGCPPEICCFVLKSRPDPGSGQRRPRHSVALRCGSMRHAAKLGLAGVLFPIQAWSRVMSPGKEFIRIGLASCSCQGSPYSE